MSTISGGDQVDLLDDPDALEAFLNDDTIIPSCTSQQFDLGALSGSMGQVPMSACANNSFTKPVQIVQPTVQQAPRASHISPAAQLNNTKTSSNAAGPVAASTSNSTSQPVGVGSQPSTSALAQGAPKCSPAASGAAVPTALVQQNVNIMNISLQPAASGATTAGGAQNQTHAVSMPMQLPLVQVPVSMAGAGGTGSLGSGPTAAFSLIQVPNGQLILQPLMSTANLQLVTLGPSQLGVAMAGGNTAPQQQPQSQQHAAPASSFVVSTPSQHSQFADAAAVQRPAAKARGGPGAVSTPRPVLKAPESTATPIRMAASPRKPAAPAPASAPTLAPAAGKAASKRPGNAIVVTNYSKQTKRAAPAVASAPAAPSKTGAIASTNSSAQSVAAVSASTNSSATVSRNAAPTVERQRNVVWRGAIERQLRAAESLAPFAGPDDALERLIAYHLYQDADRRPDPDAAAFTSWPIVLSDVKRGGRERETADQQFDAAFEKTCQSLKQRCDALFATWSHMQAKESCLNSNLTAKCEQLLLDRLQLDTFRDLHEREKHGPVEEVQEPTATVELETETKRLEHDLKCEPKYEPESYEEKKPLATAVATPDSADLQSAEHTATTNFELDTKIDLDLAAREERRRKKKKRREERRQRHDLPVADNPFVTSIATEPNRVKLVIRMKAPSSVQPTTGTGTGVVSLPAARTIDQHEHTNAQAEEARAAAEQLLLDG